MHRPAHFPVRPIRSRIARGGAALLAGGVLCAVAPGSASAGLIAPPGTWPTDIVGAANPLAGTPFVFNGANATANASLQVWLPVGGRHRTSVTRAIGGRTIVRGRLRSRGARRPIVGAAVTLVAQSGYGGPWFAGPSFRTNGKGLFRAILPAGSHRRTAVIYYPTVTSGSPLFSRRLLVRASGRVTLAKPFRKGRAFRFDGDVSGAPVPSTGLLVALQVRNRSGRWVTARLGRTGPSGHFRVRTRFPRGRLTVRVLLPAQTGWTLYGANSRTRRIHPR